jgi:uncharacterized phage-associated protein
METPMFNLEKSLQAILYVAGKLQRKDFHKIFKVLYFSDREHLAKYGRAITGDTYIKMLNGPVPSKIYDIFKAVRGDCFFANNVDMFKKVFTVDEHYLVNPLQPANLDFLSETDVEELDNALSKYGNMSYEEIKSISHDIAWKEAKDDSPISIKNILKEAGQKEDYISYISEHLTAQHYFC